MIKDLNLKQNDDGSGFHYHFDRLFVSDVHFLTRHCEAAGLSRGLDLFQSNKLSLGGDIFDLYYGYYSKKWKVHPEHISSIAKIIEKANTGTLVDMKPGNHDLPLRGRSVDSKGDSKAKHNIYGKNIYGISFSGDYELYEGSDGRKILHLHGDQFDHEISKDDRSLLYRVVDAGYQYVQNIDWFLNSVGIPSRLGPEIKIRFKDIINKKLNYYERLDKMAKEVGVDIVIHGHSHNLGFETTAAGILKIDTGSQTDVKRNQFVGQMENGKFVTIEIRDNGVIHFEDEDGNKQVENLKSLESAMGNCGYVETLPKPAEKQYEDMAYNSLRVMYRMSPPINHRKKLEKIRDKQNDLISKFKVISSSIELDTINTDGSKAIAVSRIMEAIDSLPLSVKQNYWEDGIGDIYNTNAKVNKLEDQLRYIHIPVRKDREVNKKMAQDRQIDELLSVEF